MDKSQPPDSSESGFLPLAAFIVIAALFMFVSTKAGTRALGLVTIASALIQQRKGRIAYGWEGRPPSGYITGWLATILNVVFGVAGLAMVVWPEVAMGIFGWDSK